MSFAEVIVPLPIHGRFHYEIGANLEGRLAVGHRVLVPFGKRSVTGFVGAISEGAPAGLTAKKIIERLDEEPVLSEEILSLISFASDYYLAPQGEVLRIAVPPGIAAASKAKLRLTKEGRAALLTGGLAKDELEILETLKASRGAAIKGKVRLVAALAERGLLGGSISSGCGGRRRWKSSRCAPSGRW